MMMASLSAVALRHVHFEDLGTLAPVMLRRGYDVAYLDVGVDDLSSLDALSPDLLVVLGGPVGVYESDDYPFLRQEIALLKKRLACERPTLGICLGSQLIARALGARVYPMGFKEIGFAPVRLTPDGRESCLAPFSDDMVLHWHGDTFDLPERTVRLASTSGCANQAFARGPSVLGLQFHIEVSLAGFERWLIGHACELAAARRSVRDLRVAARVHAPALAQKAEAVLDSWLDRLGLRR
jgi:GMP synthase (glutamine-hydrolysing)